MQRLSILLLVAILFGAVACAPSAPSKNAPVQTQPSSTAIANVTPTRVAVPSVAPTFAPNPLNVQVKVDNKVSASAVISTTGGTLSVQGADGTKFTLTFPNGALFNDEKITLTPITAVDGLPFSGGLVGGVQMWPEGLRLFQPATLTIESPKTVAAKGFETVAFGYHQNGEGLYLTPSEVKGNVLTLEVWHFTGDGAAQATSAEIQTQQQQHVPSNAEDAFTQRVREYLGRERQAQLLGQNAPDPDFERTMGEFLREAYDRFIGPQLPIALTNCEAAPAILSRALGWLRQVQLLGYDNRFQSESALITDTMLQALVNCYNKEYDQCVIDRNIAHRTTMVAMLRQAALLGIDGRLDQSKILKCPPRSYKATGQQMEITYSGVVCDLEHPFTVNANSAFYAFTFQFGPSGPEAGSYTYSGTWFDVGPVDGAGSYTVKAIDTIPTQLNLNNAHTTHTGVGDVSGSQQMNIDLVPLETSCR